MNLAWRRWGRSSCAHLVLSGAPQCQKAGRRFGVGTWMANAQAADLAPTGRPYGRVCAICERMASRVRRAAHHGCVSTSNSETRG